MNWKDAPNLFWNGKFRFLHNGKLLPNDSFVSLNLHDEGATPRDIEISERYSETEDYQRWVDILDCTLIARKIEDMTDEEVKEMYSIPGNSVESLKQMRDFTEMKANNGNLKFSEAIYLLSIGVYPFDQSHFEDGTVIDVNLSKPTQHTEK